MLGLNATTCRLTCWCTLESAPKRCGECELRRVLPLHAPRRQGHAAIHRPEQQIISAPLVRNSTLTILNCDWISMSMSAFSCDWSTNGNLTCHQLSSAVPRDGADPSKKSCAQLHLTERLAARRPRHKIGSYLPRHRMTRNHLSP